MNTLCELWKKLSRSKAYREAFVAAQLKKGIPAQIRVMIQRRGWKQTDLAERSGLTQGAISRAADPDYGNLTFNNALKIAAGFDVAFVGRFVPFSQLARWYDGMSDEALAICSFDEDRLPELEDLNQEAEALKRCRKIDTVGHATELLGNSSPSRAGRILCPTFSTGTEPCAQTSGAMFGLIGNPMGALATTSYIAQEEPARSPMMAGWVSPSINSTAGQAMQAVA